MNTERTDRQPAEYESSITETTSRVKSEHEDLRRLANMLKTARNSGEDATVFECAEKMYHTLKDHFEFEEEGDGFFEEIQMTKPRLGSIIENLRAQHFELHSILDSIRKSPEKKLEKVNSLIDDFLTLFYQHEEAEDKLIEEHFYRDHGGWGT